MVSSYRSYAFVLSFISVLRLGSSSEVIRLGYSFWGIRFEAICSEALRLGIPSEGFGLSRTGFGLSDSFVRSYLSKVFGLGFGLGIRSKGFRLGIRSSEAIRLRIRSEGFV